MNNQENKKINKIDSKQQCSNERRQFISKFGKLAVVTPIGVTTLMSSFSSKAIDSGTDDGFEPSI